MAAVKQNWGAFQYASERLENDRLIVMEAAKQDRRGLLRLEHFSLQFRNDFDIVLAAAKQDGLHLEYTSERWQDNFEIVMAEVKQTGDPFSSLLKNCGIVVILSWQLLNKKERL